MTRPFWKALVWIAWTTGHRDAACALWERSGLWRVRRRTLRERAVLGLLWSLGTALMVLAVGLVFLTLGPRVLPFQTYTVLSGSMRPVIAVGSIAVLEPVGAGELGVGDIITFGRPDRPTEFVTHRIIRVEPRAEGPVFITKGDANGVEDPWEVPAGGRGWRYVWSIPFLGYVLVTMQSPIGRVLLLLLPALALAGWTLLELWRPAPRLQPRMSPA